MASLSSDVDLDLTSALAGIDTLGTALNTVVTEFATGLGSSLDVLSNITIAAPDTEAVSTAISDAVVTGTAAPAVVTADAGDVTASIDQAVNVSDTTVTPTADTTELTSSIGTAVADANAVVTVTADTTEAQTAIDDLAASADTAAGSGSAGGTGGAGVAGLAGGVGDLVGKLSEVQGAGTGALESIGGLASVSLPAVAGVTGLVAGITKLTEEGIAATGAQQRLDAVTGQYAKTVETVKIGGLNTSLTELALKVGSTDTQLQNAAASIFTFGVSSGTAAPEVAKTVSAIEALAARAVALRPSLGDVGDVADRMTRSLASGGPRAVQFGIALTSAQIAAEAHTLALQKGESAVTQFDKVEAGVILTTQQLGNSLGSDINTGAQNVEVQFKSLEAQFKQTLGEVGKPLVAPALQTLRELTPALVTLFTDLGAAAHVALDALVPVVGVVSTVVTTLGGPLASILNTVGQSFDDTARKASLFFSSLNSGDSQGTTKQLGSQTQAWDDLTGAIGDTIGKALQGPDVFGALNQALGFSGDSAKKATVDQAALQHQQSLSVQASNEQAKATLAADVATGALSQAQVDAALKTATSKDGYIAYATALNGVTSAAGGVAGSQPTVAAALGTTSTNIGTQTSAWEKLGVAVTAGTITSAEFVQVAAQFGVATSQITSFAAAVSSAVSTEASQAAGALSSFGSAIDIAFGAVNIDKTTANFKQQADAINNYTKNLASLGTQFAAVGIEAQQAGPIAGGALLDAFNKATPLQKQALEQQAQNVITANQNIITQEGLFGPQFAATTAAAAQQGTAAFGNNLTLQNEVQKGVNAIAPTFSAVNAGVAAANAGADVFGAGLGTHTGGQFVVGLDGQEVFIKDAGSRAVGAADPGTGGSAGLGIGVSIGEGIVQGIQSATVKAQIAQAAKSLLATATSLFHAAGFGGSPYKLFADTVGTDIGTGIALGIVSPVSIEAVNTAAKTLISGAVSTAQSAIPAATFAGVNGVASSAPLQVNITVPVTAAAGMTQADARTLGNQIGQTVNQVLDERKIRALARAV